MQGALLQERSDSAEAIIKDTLRRGPEISVASSDGRWRFSRWRQFLGSYALPGLPDPLFVVQLAGKSDVRTWVKDSWSEATSFPGAATIVPATMPTRWLVDGELDCITLSVDSYGLEAASVLDRFSNFRFAFDDPLGSALARQISTELYQPASGARDAYVSALIDALKAHMLRGAVTAPANPMPTSAFSSYRIHHIMNAVSEHPEAEYSVEEMAAQAGLTPSHFSRVFKKATGISPHQYVLKARLERAQRMLAESETSMKVIADLLGFTSQSHFNRAFRTHLGETPTSFRARRQGTRMA